MNWVVVAGGLGLIVVAVVDLYVTTVSMRGGGPVSLRLTNVVWHATVRAGASHRMLEVVGALMLPLTVLVWLSMFYLGWVLVLTGLPGAVVHASTGVAADLGDRLYYVGYVMTTLGNGELRPVGPLARTASVAAALTGLGVTTLAITYVIPVLTSVITSRRVARTISSLGTRPDEILATAWDGTDLTRLNRPLSDLAAPLAELSQRFMAYPVLHYFHSSTRDTAIAPAVSALDDALGLIRYGAAPQVRPDPFALDAATGAVQVLLDALEAAHIDPAADADTPPLAVLHQLGIPSVAVADYAAHGDELASRRALLASFRVSDGWPDGLDPTM